MACYNPMQALRLDSINTKSGKNVICFIPRKDNDKYVGNPNLIKGLPCGRCIGCRLERSRQWAIRCVKESELHDDNCFITLTFDEPHLQARDRPMSLDKSEFQDFMKRMRRRLSDPDDVLFRPEFSMFLPKDERKYVRYYMCGEYGELRRRPHYHAILFGLDFPDKVLEQIKDGKRYYSSATLKSLWPFGNNIISDVNFDTCAYVARYIMKKRLGKDSERYYYDYFDEETGEFVGHRIPEYTTMSRRSGISKAWLDKYLQDVYPKDKIYMLGRGYSKPPKYFDTQYEVVNPEDYSRIKSDRVTASEAQAHDNTVDRLHVKEVVKLSKISVLKRNLE